MADQIYGQRPRNTFEIYRANLDNFAIIRENNQGTNKF